ncbi:chaperone SurA [Geobacter sp. OR-1]|uniref:peptidylprolyl isomerase n=1 Tax=Geobacter sp. OR-1 TaxID=1266765 RepID=UPI0005430D1B|nr:peptidylprolyl isomerase [Geobacter sp. OR-1]GAM08555.1 chaperone SurA [Geobacter sp. OR-1]
MIRIILLLSLLLSAAPVMTAGAEVISGIVAIVNEEIITTRDLDGESRIMAREAGRKEPYTPEELQKLRVAAINRLVDRRLVDQKIRELDIKVSEEEVRQSIEEVKKQNNMSQERLVEALAGQGLSFDQYKAQIKEQLERLRLMSQEVKAKVQVTLKEVLEYYQANRAKFGEQELYRARHILFVTPKDATDSDLAKIRAKADKVLTEAQGGADFTELAKKYSDDPNVSTDGGELGTFKKGDLLPEMEAVVLKLNPGEVSAPVRSKSGFHIIKLEKKFLGDIKPFDDVKGEIEESLYRKKSEERFNQWVSELRKGAAVEIRP